MQLSIHLTTTMFPDYRRVVETKAVALEREEEKMVEEEDSSKCNLY